MSKSLPESANLDWLKKTAKQKLRQWRADGKEAQLADAQLAVAREYGFASWRAMRSQITPSQKEEHRAAGDTLGPCSPFFIVSNLEASIEHYTRKLGFDCRFKGPDGDKFFAILGRGSAQLMIKRPLRNDWIPLAYRIW